MLPSPPASALMRSAVLMMSLPPRQESIIYHAERAPFPALRSDGVRWRDKLPDRGECYDGADDVDAWPLMIEISRHGDIMPAAMPRRRPRAAPSQKSLPVVRLDCDILICSCGLRAW